MKFEKKLFGTHYILHALLDANSPEMALALTQSAQKADKVHKDDPSGLERNVDVVRSQNFLGTLADIVCARMLETYFKKHNIGIDVTRYDDVRTDDYQNPDQYDIKLSSLGRDYLVEVRSSACIYMPLESMIDRWQILGPYVSSTKGATETIKPFYLRPLFHLSSFHENRETRRYQRTAAQDLISNGDLQLYFVGGATSALLEKKGRDEEGQELKQGKAQFRVLNIKDGLDAKEMLQTIARLACKGCMEYGYDKTKT